MSARREIWEVARRELLERWRSRAMRVSFAILLAFVVGGAVLLTLVDERTPTDDFGLVGPRAVALAPALRIGEQADGRRARLHRLRDRAAAERALREGDVDVAIVDGRLIVKEERASLAAGAAQRAVAAQHTVMRVQAAGLTGQQAHDTLNPPPQRLDVLDRGARDRQRDEDMLFVGMVALFMALVVYGQSVASSVAEEKSTRVIELLLTTLPPRRLLAGKILGVGTLGVSQLAAVCVAGLLSAQVAGGEELPPSAPEPWRSRSGGSSSASRSTASPTPPSAPSITRGGPGGDDRADQRPADRGLFRRHGGDRIAGRRLGADRRVPAAAGAADVPTRALGDMSAIGLLAAVTISLLATVLLVRVAAGIDERSVLRTGAPSACGPRSPTARHTSVRAASGRRRRCRPGAATALLGGILVGTDKPLGIVFVAIGLDR